MSHITATVKEIESCNSLHIVKFNCNGQTLSMMSLELGENIKTGTKVKLVVKPSHIAIAKSFNGEVSYTNQLQTTITHIENGALLSSVKLQLSDTILESIITVEAAGRMELKVGDTVTTFIKASELSIQEVLDG